MWRSGEGLCSNWHGAGRASQSRRVWTWCGWGRVFQIDDHVNKVRKLGNFIIHVQGPRGGFISCTHFSLNKSFVRGYNQVNQQPLVRKVFKERRGRKVLGPVGRLWGSLGGVRVELVLSQSSSCVQPKGPDVIAPPRTLPALGISSFNSRVMGKPCFLRL